MVNVRNMADATLLTGGDFGKFVILLSTKIRQFVGHSKSIIHQRQTIDVWKYTIVCNPSMAFSCKIPQG